MLQVTAGEPGSVSTFEGLAILVACRLWKSSTHVGTRVSVRSDSLSALTAVAKQKARAHGLGLIMAELALTRAFDSVDFSELTHVPGAGNGTADALSRTAAPEPCEVPADLDPRLQSAVEQRTRAGPGLVLASPFPCRRPHR